MLFDYNKVESLYPGAGGLIQPPMLIWKLPAGKEYQMSTVCSSGEYFAQEKIDGCLYTYVNGREGQSYLFGRTVSKITGIATEKGENVPHILQALSCLPPATVIVGEIYYDGCTAKDVTTIMGCSSDKAVQRQEDPKGRGRIHYYIHDLLFYDGVNLTKTGAYDRYRILKAIYHKHNLDQYGFLRLATIVEENIEDEVSRILSRGGEGMVLKKKTAPYTYDKRPAHDTIKFKQMDDTDLVCTRCIDPTREYTGKEFDTWPYWEDRCGTLTVTRNITREDDWKFWHYYFDENGDTFCYIDEKEKEDSPWLPVTKPYALGWKSAIGIGAYDDDGNLVELGTVSSGLTDEDKQAMGENPDAFVGKVVSLHCMSKDKKEHTLRHPVFRGWREDKNAEDCKISEVFR